MDEAAKEPMDISCPEGHWEVPREVAAFPMGVPCKELLRQAMHSSGDSLLQHVL
jgi:hypothetical protein